MGPTRIVISDEPTVEMRFIRWLEKRSGSMFKASNKDKMALILDNVAYHHEMGDRG